MNNKWIATTAVAMLLLSGCGVSGDRNAKNDTTVQQPAAQPPAAQQPAVQPPANQSTPNISIGGQQNTTTPQISVAAQADHLANLARHVPGVKDANCVIFGKNAIVSVNVDGSLNSSQADTLKNSVNEAVNKDKDPYGLKTFVTADADLNSRLAKIAQDIRAGHPIQGFTKELTDIITRIVPKM